MNLKPALAPFCLAIVLPLLGSCHGIGWWAVEEKIRHDFPDVKRITTPELAAWLKDANRKPPVLLDVRTKPEYEVSHLKNAQRVQPGSPASAIQIPKDQPIVTYCAVGYRSGAFAQTLERAGYTQVLNMEGSIFKWANEGRPVFRDGEQVEKVHPYNEKRGLLLGKARRAKVPPNPQ